MTMAVTIATTKKMVTASNAHNFFDFELEQRPGFGAVCKG
jgi:hypothetical protein